MYHIYIIFVIFHWPNNFSLFDQFLVLNQEVTEESESPSYCKWHLLTNWKDLLWMVSHADYLIIWSKKLISTLETNFWVLRRDLSELTLVLSLGCLSWSCPTELWLGWQSALMDLNSTFNAEGFSLNRGRYSGTNRFTRLLQLRILNNSLTLFFKKLTKQNLHSLFGRPALFQPTWFKTSAWNIYFPNM